MENWKEIIDAQTENAHYFISDLGRIRVEKGTTTIIKIGYKQINGYLGVTFGHDDRRNVHVLVGQYFCNKPEGSQCLNHINGIKTDNLAVNLEWVTYAQNNLHAYETGLKTQIGDKHFASIDRELVYRIYELKKEGNKLREVAKLVQLNYGTLKCIYNGKNWRYDYEKFFGRKFSKTGLGGEVSWNSYPKETVLKIYELKKQGKRIFEIANEVEMKFHTVKQIYHGKNWRHLYKEHFGDML
jgi:hypothetical protein